MIINIEYNDKDNDKDKDYNDKNGNDNKYRVYKCDSEASE